MRLTFAIDSYLLSYLKTLELNSVTYKDDNSVQTLISSCLVLENLSIHRDRHDNVKIYRLFAPALKHLKIDFDFEYFEDSDYDSSHCGGLDINAPANNDLCCKVQADYTDVYRQYLIRCPQALRSVKFLSLSTHTYMDESSRWNFTDNRKSYIVPDHVPKCFLSCLKAVSIDDYSMDTNNELATIEYILKNGKVLETADIHHHHMKNYFKSDSHVDADMFDPLKIVYSKEKFSIVQKNILKFPRGSEICKITFS
ncbi:hypothetical protein ACH5RR_029023 [Cinchona calisaya]|uniref:FBD domain-containing protein n=1 Tax=Cinchona calisaya TaxID=153742 RepID=A0ABD2YQG8_9GENT